MVYYCLYNILLYTLPPVAYAYGGAYPAPWLGLIVAIEGFVVLLRVFPGLNINFEMGVELINLTSSMLYLFVRK